MEPLGDKVRVYNASNQRVMRENILGPVKRKQIFYRLIMVLGVLGIWQLAANSYNSDLLLPPTWKTLVTFATAVHDPEVLLNLSITLRRVLTGFSYALLLGIPLGFLMGYSKVALHLLEPLIDSLRQVPIMAWVPLTIVWFGLGDGPTIFLIAFAGVFPIILNTIAGVQNIPKDYYHAARSMGAGPWSIFAHVIVPGALPDILTGGRIAVGMGWMSVIWAEFIATSAGFGYSMVEAETRMQTDMLFALMIMAALVGYGIDRVIQLFNSKVTKWRFIQ